MNSCHMASANEDKIIIIFAIIITESPKNTHIKNNSFFSKKTKKHVVRLINIWIGYSCGYGNQ